MIDSHLSWFAIGATCSAVLFGWPWHPRFSRFSRRRPYSSAAIAFRATAEDAARVRSKIVNPLAWEDPPEPMTVEEWARRSPRRTPRWFINNPVQIAECGGPCTTGPEHCDCGALWVDVPASNQPPSNP